MKRKFDFAKYAPVFALILLFGISAVASPYFLQVRNLLNILRQVSYTGVIGLGMTFVIISGGIDLSVGSAAAFTGGLAVLMLNRFGGGVPAIILAILVGLVVGTLTG